MFAEFKQHGHGVLALLNRGELRGWYFIDVKHVIAIEGPVISLDQDWMSSGKSVERWRSIFIWKQRPLNLYGPVNLKVPAPKSSPTFPRYDFLFHEELISERVLSGDMHCVLPPDVEFNYEDVFVPAPSAIWRLIHFAWFEKETDGIIAVSLMDDHVSDENVNLLLKHRDRNFGYMYWQKHNLAGFTSGGLVVAGQLNIIGSGISIGKSMMVSADILRRALKLETSMYGTKKKIKHVKAIKPRPKPHHPQHRITSVQRRGK